jgi:hypothetical protein
MRTGANAVSNPVLYGLAQVGATFGFVGMIISGGLLVLGPEPGVGANAIFRMRVLGLATSTTLFGVSVAYLDDNL